MTVDVDSMAGLELTDRDRVDEDAPENQDFIIYL